MTIPNDLIAEIRDGRAVLFLGSGASIGAKHPSGAQIPDCAGLAAAIARKFLSERYEKYDLQAVCDLSANRKDVPTVQTFIRELLVDYQPAVFHSLVPSFPWAGIITTNYDLIVERAFEAFGKKNDQLIVVSKDLDGGIDAGSEGVLYLKVHGCISCHREVKPPMIATTEQLIRHKEGRVGMLSTVLEWSKTKTLIFCGYSFMDQNLRSMFDEIIREGDNRPRHYIVNPGLEEFENNYWSERRVRPINMSFEDFLGELEQKIPRHSRQLGHLASDLGTGSLLGKHRSTTRAESESLRQYLSSGCTVVSHITQHHDFTAAQFYSGLNTEWSFIPQKWDIRRRVVDRVINERILSADLQDSSLIAIKSHAGSGKSIALRRIAWEAAKDHNKFVLYIAENSRLKIELIEEIFQLTNERVHLFVDNAGDLSDEIAALMRLARQKRWPLLLITAERVNEWNVQCDELDAYLTEEYDTPYLTPAEIDELLLKLDQNNCLGSLKDIKGEERKAFLAERAGRQILVALHEATHGRPFSEIIANEYTNIPSLEAQLLYLDICSLHRFGPPVRAGLISRVHDISFDQFREKFFKPLERVVSLREEKSSGDYVYQARHQLIAEMVYNQVLSTQEARFENLMRIVSKLNPAYSYDLQVIQRVIRAENIAAIFSERLRGEAIYETALKALGRSFYVFHQWGIYEMKLAGDVASLTRAEGLFNKALEEQPNNLSVRHSLAELALKRSRLADDERERYAWRQKAASQASALIGKAANSHPYHTVAKALVDTVVEALKKAEDTGDELSTLALESAIKDAEDKIRAGLQRFPGDSYLLHEEARLAETLRNIDKALSALEKAFRANPKSEIVVRRLAQVYEAKGMQKEAVATLRRGLEYNAGHLGLNYQLAQAILKTAPDADQKHSDELLHHLRRSFNPNDRNYLAQFWYARQLTLANRFDDALPIFQTLKQAQLPYRSKREVKGVVLDEMGHPIRFQGTIRLVREAFGFVDCASPFATAYFEIGDEAKELRGLSVRQRASFGLGFSLLGPQALRVSPMLI